MKRPNLRMEKIVWLLLIVSLVLYGLDYLIFGHAPEIAAGILGNLAFLPIYVLFVTLMIERVLKERERLAIRRKLNMVIGVFFSEVGTGLLRDFPMLLRNGGEVMVRLKVTGQWGHEEFRQAAAFLKHYDLKVDCRNGKLPSLKSFLAARRGFMLGLLENPNLLEHDEFTDLLWAVFHLIEELDARKSLEGLSSADLEHLDGDIRRVYHHLTREWISYMEHLKHDYPYLFSLAVRMNPFDPRAHAEVGES